MFDNFSSQQSSVAFQGDLSVVTVDNLMHLLGHASLYGELQLTTPGNSAAFFINNGSLVYSHLKKNPMKLGTRLIQRGYITNEQLNDCLTLYYNKDLPRPKIGKLLIEMNYLKQEDLEKILKEQSKDIFFEVLSWKRGSFAFLVRGIPMGEDILLDERIDHLTLQGCLQLDEYVL